MSRPLPAELKTQKTNSLPDDLKGIAEELIAKKFGVEEEIVDKSTAPFHSSQSTAYANATEPRMGNDWRDRVERGFDPFSRRSLVRANINGNNLEALSDAMRSLDMNNIPVEGRIIYLHPDTYRNIMMHPQMMMASYQEGSVKRIWGCEIRRAQYGSQFIEAYDRF